MLKAVLLSDARVARLLREEVVPCWEMIRPVPRVTIEFGEGRKVVRTLKGNTAFYLCLPDGRTVDVFPGVYTADDFLAEVRPALSLIARHRLARPGSSFAPVMAYHRAAPSVAAKLGGTATKKVARKGAKKGARKVALNRGKTMGEAPILSAAEKRALIEAKMRLSKGKGQVERPVLRQIKRGQAVKAGERPTRPAPKAAPARLSQGKKVMEAPVLKAVGKGSAKKEQVFHGKRDAELTVLRRLPTAAERAARRAFEAMAARTEDVSTKPASVVALRRGESAAEKGMTPAERGRALVELDSRTGVRHLRPAARLLLLSRGAQTPAQLKTDVFETLMHIRIDDPYLGLKDVLVPGSED